MKQLISLCFLVLSLTSMSAKEVVKEVDVCVYGGTASGVIAAYSARQMGKTVILIEPTKYLGGMTTGGLGATDIGNKYAITGLARQFYRNVGALSGKFEQWTFSPSVAMQEIMRYVNKAKLDVVYERRITSAKKNNKRIESIVLEECNPSGKSESMTVKAKQFIDCTYEGDLMAKSGASYFVGRESAEEYEETLNGVQMSVWHQFPDGVDPYKVEGDPSSGYCWGINNNTLKPKRSGDKLVQAYNFRLCLTRNINNMVPFERPASYDSTQFELLARAIKKMGPGIEKYMLIKLVSAPDEKYDVNNCGPLSTDMIGMNYDYPDGDYKTRERIWKEHVEYTKGFLYFMSHDKRVPEELRNQVREYGWAKDEFVDNDNFPTQLYVREARRLNGEYVMSQQNCQGAETVGDGVGMAAYGMDSHNCQRIVVNGMVKNEGDVQFHGFAPYPISYRSITPKRTEVTNLLVPVCVSSTHIAFGSIRMEPVFMVLGQSAGVAASMAIDAKSSVQEIDVNKLRKILRTNPYLDGTLPEVMVDEGDIDKIVRTSGWRKSYGASYKTSYMYAPNAAKNTTFTFLPIIKKEGEYEVFFYCIPLGDNVSNEMVVQVKHANGKTKVVIDPVKNHSSWVSLGTYSFNKGDGAEIMVDGTMTNGGLIADAVILRPVGATAIANK